MEEPQRRERRLLNLPVGEERRQKSADRRRCPECGSTVRQDVQKTPEGSLTLSYCSKCEWRIQSRQLDAERVRALAGFELQVVGGPQRSHIDLEPALLKVTGWVSGDRLELKAIYTPDGESAFSWVVRKVD
jgi:hypothetical protein